MKNQIVEYHEAKQNVTSKYTEKYEGNETKENSEFENGKKLVTFTSPQLGSYFSSLVLHPLESSLRKRNVLFK